MTKFKEFRVADISTRHVTEQDRQLLLNPECPRLYGVQKDGCGAMIYTTPGKDNLEYLKECGFSDAFVDIYRDADEQGIAYILFDCDGHVSPDLPTYEN